MAREDFAISATSSSVDVQLTPSVRKPNGKLVALFSALGMMLLCNCFFLFMPGKHNQPSFWSELTTGSPTSPLIFIVVFNVYMLWIVFRGERGSSPSDETFRCDRNEIMISRSTWLDLENRHPRTSIYPLSACSDIRFGRIFTSGRSAIDGIRFLVNGRKQWALPGLDATDAKQILMGLRNLGAQVVEDSYVEERIKQSRALQDGDTSWMDRSWMDKDSKSSDS